MEIPEVADFMRTSPSFVRKAIAGMVPGAPPLKSLKVGRRRIVRVADLLDWIESQNKEIHTPAEGD